MRGILSEEIKQKSQELLGYELTQDELRLMPYLQYCAINDKNIDPRSVNNKERRILMDWQDKGYIKSPTSMFGISKMFYDAISELLWLGYIVSVERDKE
ncbi:hypothetical protein A6B39_10560 [Mannheimia granulomatis]|uniref:hypothetical protein n=1 Tax=Pasteurellaceae TaxID=712 RepID=UPI00037D6FE4|nr:MULTISPECIES: hypothetical protein [Pasteurellaceae]QLB15857.1 hypothetical protein A6B39_10560 [Mannheimia granulomatis]